MNMTCRYSAFISYRHADNTQEGRRWAKWLAREPNAEDPANGFLPGRFDSQWKPTVKWSCLTGDCQLGINWGRLYKITGDAKYRDATTTILGFVKRTQKLTGSDRDTVGGIKGSHPIDGGYHPWQYPNWATKFYADALMMDMANNGGPDYVIAPKGRT